MSATMVMAMMIMEVVMTSKKIVTYGPSVSSEDDDAGCGDDDVGGSDVDGGNYDKGSNDNGSGDDGKYRDDD